jgi:dihydroorotase
VAVLRVVEGDFGFVDSFGGRQPGNRKFVCEMTLRGGKVVYDLNGLARPDWPSLPRDYRSTGDPRWEGR